MNRRILFYLPVLAVAGMLFSRPLPAAVPAAVNYQGRLTDPAGDLVDDGLYQMVFKLYQDGDTLVWTETFAVEYRVRVVNGVFNVRLGSGDNDGDLGEIFRSYDNLYLGMTVGEDAEMAPRRRIASAGYSFQAGASGADNPVGTIQISAAVEASSGWLLCDGAAVSREEYADLFAVIGATYGGGDGSTTFQLPNFQDRFALGGSSARAPGSMGGVAAIDLAHSHTVDGHSHSIATVSLKHSHSYSGSVSGGAHQHLISLDLYSQIGDTSDNADCSKSNTTVLGANHGHRLNFWTTAGEGGHSHSYSGNTAEYDLGHGHGATGGASPGTDSKLSSAQSIVPPYLVVNYVIKY